MKQSTAKQKNKYLGISTALAIPALIFFFIFLVIPMLQTLLITFKDYTPARGVYWSSWVGFENITAFLQSTAGWHIFINTAVISVAAVIAGSLYVFALTCSISKIRNVWLKTFAACASVLPALIPAQILAFALKGTPILLSPLLYRLAAIGNEVLCIAPIAALAGVLLCFHRFDIKKAWFTALGYGAIRLILLFSSDINYLLATYNPQVYETADVLEIHAYRQGILYMNISGSSAPYFLKILIGIIPLIAGVMLLFYISGRNKNVLETSKISLTGNRLSLVLIIPVLLFAFVLSASVSGINPFTNPIVFRGLANSFSIGIVSCVFTLIFALSFAYAMVNANKVIVVLSAFFLLIGGNIIGQYLQIRVYGLMDTFWAVIICNTLSAVLYAFFIFLAFGGFQSISFKGFLKRAVPSIVILFGIGFARFYGYILLPSLYLRDRMHFSISLILREAMLMGEEVPVSTVLPLMIPVVIAVASITAAFWLASKSEDTRI
jgi:putative aldouronate transport system permease protein